MKYASFNVIELSGRRRSRKTEEDRLGGGVKYLCGPMFGPRGFAGWHGEADRLKESALSAPALAQGVCFVPQGRVKGTAGSGWGRDRMRSPPPPP